MKSVTGEECGSHGIMSHPEGIMSYQGHHTRGASLSSLHGFDAVEPRIGEGGPMLVPMPTSRSLHPSFPLFPEKKNNNDNDNDNDDQEEEKGNKNTETDNENNSNTSLLHGDFEELNLTLAPAIGERDLLDMGDDK